LLLYKETDSYLEVIEMFHDTAMEKMKMLYDGKKADDVIDMLNGDEKEFLRNFKILMETFIKRINERELLHVSEMKCIGYDEFLDMKESEINGNMESMIEIETMEKNKIEVAEEEVWKRGIVNRDGKEIYILEINKYYKNTCDVKRWEFAQDFNLESAKMFVNKYMKWEEEYNKFSKNQMMQRMKL